MDLRRWTWRNPWERHTYVVCTLLFLTTLLQHAKAGETSYQQDPKNKIPDSNKLDSLSNYLPFDSVEDSDYKRASSFFPLRGKKPSADDSLAAHQLFMSNQYDSEDKRAQFYPLRGKKVPDDLKRASYFMPMRGRKDDGWSEDYDVTDESPNSKRASSFMPMRGKKRYAAISDYLTKAGTYANDVSEVLSHSGSQSQIDDKRMQSFVPVRGKRSLEEPSSNGSPTSLGNGSNDTVSNHSTKKRSVFFLPMRGLKENQKLGIENEGIATRLVEKKHSTVMPSREDYPDEYSIAFDKKASNFMPMRGRRNFDDDLSSEKENIGESKRAQSFMPMRGRRSQLRDVVYDSDYSPEIESRLIEDKRASSFMPMRGKRSASEDTHRHVDGHLKFDKKASSFMPMRGRRSISDEDSGGNSQNDSHSNKRATFMPMRGRRLVNDEFDVEPFPADQLYSLLDKKSSSFMPMRGRKNDDEDFTVAPWQADQLMSLLNKKSSSFMPMRGRRFDEEETFTVAPWPADQLMPLLDKKSSSFMPMRGRRFDEETFTVAPWPADQLMPLLDKKSSSFMPMRGRRYDEEAFTVSPWPADQLMPLLDKKASSFMPMRGRRYHDETFTVAPWTPDQLMPLLDKKYAFVSSAGIEDSGEADETVTNITTGKRSSFMPMRGRRQFEMEQANFYNPYPYLMAGIGSSLMSKPYSDRGGVSFTSVRSPEARRKKLRINWDAVKRAFHATRGKRTQEIDDLVDSMRDTYLSESQSSPNTNESLVNESDKQTRTKRSIVRPRVSIQPSRTYIALKRPMSFFATRGKRLDDSAIDNLSKLH